MAATIREISDALVECLENVTSLGPGKAGIFAGTAGDFVEQCRNAPFAGIVLESADYTELASDSSLSREDLTFRIILIVQDFRGPGFSLEDGYALLDPLRRSLMGADLGLEGLAPLTLSSITRDKGVEEQGLEVFTLRVLTWQVVMRG